MGSLSTEGQKTLYSIATNGPVATEWRCRRQALLLSERSALTSRASACERTLTKQQVISEQTDEVDTARLGVVGPRGHGYLLARAGKKPVGKGWDCHRSLLTSPQEDEDQHLEFPANSLTVQPPRTPQVQKRVKASGDAQLGKVRDRTKLTGGLPNYMLRSINCAVALGHLEGISKGVGRNSVTTMVGVGGLLAYKELGPRGRQTLHKELATQ